jgi:hypothetical protein
MITSVCLSPLLISFEPVGRFNEIWQGGHTIAGDHNSISLFNPIALTSKIVAIQIFLLIAKMYQLMWHNKILYYDRASKDE